MNRKVYPKCEGQTLIPEHLVYSREEKDAR